MLKRVNRLFVHDSPRRRTRDEILHAVASGKLYTLGTTWAGDIKPVLDSGLTAITPLVNGLTSGRVLHADELAGVVDLGRAWTGDLVSRIRAAASSSSQSGPTVDVGETLAETERLDLLLRSATPNSGAIADGLRRLRRAADRVGGARTGDSNPLKRLTMLTPEQRASGPGSPENLRANDFWARQSAPVTPGRAIGDNSAARTTEVRDQLAIAKRATNMRGRMEALNRAATAFWART